MTWRAGEFQARVVHWWRQNGRHDLPWQHTRDPYRVWLSEIMLQQTQVATVLPYYARFLQRFPDVGTLARGSEQEVLALWAGLGYYARARHLHRCARQVVEQHGGHFPRSAEALQQLPGIGRSTAAAIAAFCFGERRAILDGNVRRLLARVFAIVDDLGRGGPLRALWERAEALLPTERLREDMPAYTQGLMDLGATVCLPRQPACDRCPLADRCLAHAEGSPERYPVARPVPERQRLALWLLQAIDRDGRIWLERRPARGIWAGLHCLPVFESRAALLEQVPPRSRAAMVEHPARVHLLTHRRLVLHLVTTRLARSVQLDRLGNWFDAPGWQSLGLPAPVRRILSA